MTTTTTTEPTESTESMLTMDDFIAARVEELAALEVRGREDAIKIADDKRTRALETFARAVESAFTPRFLAAIHLGEAVYIPDTDYETNGYYSSVEAQFTHDGETWILYYWNGGLHVRGPNGYGHDLDSEYIEHLRRRICHRSFLDGLMGYPDWLKQKQEHDAQQLARETEDASRPTTPAKPKRPIYIEGGERGLIRYGAEIVVFMAAANGGPYYGTVKDVNKRAILLEMDGGQVIVINRAHAAVIGEKPTPTDDVPF